MILHFGFATLLELFWNSFGTLGTFSELVGDFGDTVGRLLGSVGELFGNDWELFGTFFITLS